MKTHDKHEMKTTKAYQKFLEHRQKEQEKKLEKEK